MGKSSTSHRCASTCRTMYAPSPEYTARLSPRSPRIAWIGARIRNIIGMLHQPEKCVDGMTTPPPNRIMAPIATPCKSVRCRTSATHLSRATVAMLISGTIACADPVGPGQFAFGVSVSIETAPRWNGPVYDGCQITWRVRANDSTTVARYRVGDGAYNPSRNPPTGTVMVDSGSFSGTAMVQFVIDSTGIYGDPHTISWDVWRGDSIVTIGERRIRQNHALSPYCWS